MEGFYSTDPSAQSVVQSQLEEHRKMIETLTFAKNRLLQQQQQLMESGNLPKQDIDLSIAASHNNHNNNNTNAYVNTTSEDTEKDKATHTNNNNNNNYSINNSHTNGTADDETRGTSPPLFSLSILITFYSLLFSSHLISSHYYSPRYR